MNINEWVKHIDDSIYRAERKRSKLQPCGAPVSSVKGLCGLWGRHLWNNIGSAPGVNYLEIGTFHGAMVCSMAYGNKINATVIDNWAFTEFGEQSPEEVKANIRLFSGESKITLIEEDCWAADLSGVNSKYNVLYYDADHSQEATARAISHFLPVMDDPFVILVDDYNPALADGSNHWSKVEAGVREGLELAGLKSNYERELLSSHEADLLGWWNGVFIGIMSRS